MGQLMQSIERCNQVEHTLANGQVSQMYFDHAPHVTHELTRGTLASISGWTGTQLSWKVLALVLHRAGARAIGQHKPVEDVLITITHVKRETGLRIEALRLLESLLQKESPPLQWSAESVGRILLDAILPNAVWRAGKAAACARHAALAALVQLARHCQSEHLRFWCCAVQEASHGLLPLLLSALEDDDGEARLDACTLLHHVLSALPPSTVAYDQARTMIPEILKRLDDSRDNVRLAALRVIKSLADVIDHLNVGTYVEYITSGLLVYADDKAVQSAVIDTLKRYGSSEPEIFAKEVNKSIAHGVATSVCHELLASLEGQGSKEK